MPKEDSGIYANKKPTGGWKCRCVCGTEKILPIGFYNQKFLSCGCLHREAVLARLSARHGYPVNTAESALRYLFRSYRDKAVDRGFEFSLSPEVFRGLIDKPCFYCGLPPSNYHRALSKGGVGLTYSGIDRVDATQGYIENNVVSCCIQCNWAKADLSIAEFAAWVERLCAFQLEGAEV